MEQLTDKTVISKLKGLAPSLISLMGQGSYSDEDFEHDYTANTFLKILTELELPKEINDTLERLKDFLDKAYEHRGDDDYLELLSDMAEEWRDNKTPELICYGCGDGLEDTVHWIDELPFCEECSDAPVFFSDQRESLMRSRYASQYIYGANGKKK